MESKPTDLSINIGPKEFSTKKSTNFQPAGMIPEFNAWGNHPDNLSEYIQTHVSAAFERLGISEKYPEAESILLNALDEIAQQPSQFTGHHIPTETTRKVSDLLMNTFIKSEKCVFSGQENYERVLELAVNGNNIIIAPNHTSPLDGLVPLTLISKNYPDSTLPALVMSQVFEYARVTGLITSGVEKFPVFQPKHIKKFVDSGKNEVVKEMGRQNQTTLRSLCAEAKKGGKKVFLYFEKNRNNNGMDIPEPAVIRIPELLENTGHPLYILPMHISGVESIFPNKPGINELDVFFETLSIGQGKVNCGKPILFSDILKKTDSIDQSKIVKEILGTTFEDKKKLRSAAASILTLGLVAELAPTNEAKGIYKNPNLTNILSELNH